MPARWLILKVGNLLAENRIAAMPNVFGGLSDFVFQVASKVLACLARQWVNRVSLAAFGSQNRLLIFDCVSSGLLFRQAAIQHEY
ncbi:hypothetical protein H9Q10_07360 [Eikenella sp. S3360]|uniref:Uncharacterized protein n=1 Tax=Eikenella glucosivorans TaxID=2766967 RepID=A0ABS0NAX8_9NEIS|nr:hypothetical protein [Eikenella glucosivorans]MBH5329483.1 hypothetical protein [Eikenella glucosivorans]